MALRWVTGKTESNMWLSKQWKVNRSILGQSKIKLRQTWINKYQVDWTVADFF